MNETQIKEIMKAMEEQNKVLADLQQQLILQDKESAEYRKEREKLDDDKLQASYKVYQALQESNKNFHLDNANLRKEIAEVKESIKPILDLASSVQGFDKIAMWIMKFLLGAAALIGAGFTILHFIRQLIIPNK